MEFANAEDFDLRGERSKTPPEHDSTRTESPTLGNDATAQLLRSNAGAAVMRRAGKSQGAGPLDPEIAADIQSARGGGRALDDDVRGDMEGHFGVDFSSVRVHADGRGDQLSRSVQAEAFTTGTDVFFRSGRYQPESTDGRKLLAHELTHVVQQSSGQVAGAGQVSDPGDAHEVEAQSVADTVSAAPTAAPVDREATDELAEPAPSVTADRAEEEELEDDAQSAGVDREAAEEDMEEEPEGE